MLKAILLTAALVGCGGSVVQAGKTEVAVHQTASIACETLLDAGTPCDPCPGARSSGQVENLSGYTERFCDFPSPDGGDVGGIVWRACPANPDGTLGTCAEIRAAWDRR